MNMCQAFLAWVNLDLVPKQEVQLLWNVIPRLERCIIRYPEREIELSKFMYEVIIWFDQLFMTELMTEEHAIAVVSQHVIGPSFLKEILLNEKFDVSNVDEVFHGCKDTRTSLEEEKIYLKIGSRRSHEHTILAYFSALSRKGEASNSRDNEISH